MNIRLALIITTYALICYTAYLYPETFLWYIIFQILFVIFSLPWSTSEIYHRYIGDPNRRKETEERL